MHFRQLWPWQCDPEVALHDLVQRREIERADVQVATIRGPPQFANKRALKSHAAGEQDTDVLAFDSSHGVRERPRRRRVEPVDIVDGNKKVAGARKSSENVELALQDHESGGARGSSRRGRLPWKPSATSGSAIILALVPNRRGS